MEHEEVIQDLLTTKGALTGREKAAVQEIKSLRLQLKQVDDLLVKQEDLTNIPTRRGRIVNALGSLQFLRGQIDTLAKFILENVPGEPSQDGGAIDCAIRLLAARNKEPRPIATVEKKDGVYELTWSRGNDKSINRPAAKVYVDRPDAVLELIYILAGVTELHELQTEKIPSNRVKIFSNQRFSKLADCVICAREVWRDANNNA